MEIGKNIIERKIYYDETYNKENNLKNNSRFNKSKTGYRKEDSSLKKIANKCVKKSGKYYNKRKRSVGSIRDIADSSLLLAKNEKFKFINPNNDKYNDLTKLAQSTKYLPKTTRYALNTAKGVYTSQCVSPSKIRFSLFPSKKKFLL